MTAKESINRKREILRTLYMESLFCSKPASVDSPSYSHNSQYSGPFFGDFCNGFHTKKNINLQTEVLK